LREDGDERVNVVVAHGLRRLAELVELLGAAVVLLHECFQTAFEAADELVVLVRILERELLLAQLAHAAIRSSIRHHLHGQPHSGNAQHAAKQSSR
jgi:hypothetical protein